MVNQIFIWITENVFEIISFIGFFLMTYGAYITALPLISDKQNTKDQNKWAIISLLYGFSFQMIFPLGNIILSLLNLFFTNIYEGALQISTLVFLLFASMIILPIAKKKV